MATDERDHYAPARFSADGDLSTVDGLLRELGVESAPVDRQRRAIARALRSPVYRPHVAKLGPELVGRGLAG